MHCIHRFRSSRQTVHAPLTRYQTGPVNLTSNVVLRVDGVMRAVQNRSAFIKIGVLPSVGHDYE
jgi:hypothetical protein